MKKLPIKEIGKQFFFRRENKEERIPFFKKSCTQQKTQKKKNKRKEERNDKNRQNHKKNKKKSSKIEKEIRTLIF